MKTPRNARFGSPIDRETGLLPETQRENSEVVSRSMLKSNLVALLQPRKNLI
jgi:hypothetical protein